jgi:hypothetical protein
MIQRIRKPFQNMRLNHDNNFVGAVDEEAISDHDNRRYRFEVTRRKRNFRQNRQMHWFRRIVTLNRGCTSTSHINGSGLSDGVHPNHSIAMYLHWMFRVNFFFLFVVMCVAFFALVLFFTAFITIAGRIDSECVRVGSGTFAASGAPFADAFALSWTTISTVRSTFSTQIVSCEKINFVDSFISSILIFRQVGYGTAYPALGYQNSSPTNCFFINFICSLEALIGVLYSGFCGAILFGKVLRIQSYAQVTFSDPLLIRYGSGVSHIDGPVSNSESASDDDDSVRIPFPILEFRIVNRLFSEPGGEIMDAILNVVANKNAVNDNDSHGDGWSEDHSNHRSRQSSNVSVDKFNMGSLSSRNSTSSFDSSARGQSRHLNLFRHTNASREGQVIDEDPSSVLLNKHIFSKMEIEASEHPFFRRVWVARHILDADSPILKHKIRRQIRRKGNQWPRELNNAQAIRDCLQFNQILVSLTGVSNISACDVYAQKI